MKAVAPGATHENFLLILDGGRDKWKTENRPFTRA